MARPPLEVVEPFSSFFIIFSFWIPKRFTHIKRRRKPRTLNCLLIYRGSNTKKHQKHCPKIFLLPFPLLDTWWFTRAKRRPRDASGAGKKSSERAIFDIKTRISFDWVVLDFPGRGGTKSELIWKEASESDKGVLKALNFNVVSETSCGRLINTTSQTSSVQFD